MAKRSNQVYGKAAKTAASIMLANPLVSAIAIVIALVLLVVIGYFATQAVISNLLNIWLWAASLVAVMLARPKGIPVILGLSALIGLGFWAYQLYQEAQAMAWLCNIPFLGSFACGAWNFFTFLPKMFSLGMLVITAFIMITLIAMVRVQLTKR